MNEIIKETDVNEKTIAAVFQQAYMDCVIDHDNDVKITDDGVRTFVRFDPERKVLTMFNVWPLRESAPLEKKLEWLNRLNNKLVLVRFTMPKPDSLWCDYQLLVAGGLNPYSLVMTYRLFLNVIRGALSREDPEDFVGREKSNQAPEATSGPAPGAGPSAPQG